MFEPIRKYAASGQICGAMVSRSKDRDHLIITLGQDVMEQHLQHATHLRPSVGTGSDAGKIVLVPIKGGYKIQRDKLGKGTIRLKNPGVVKSFCNGHERIHCTVREYEHGSIILFGNNRG